MQTLSTSVRSVSPQMTLTIPSCRSVFIPWAIEAFRTFVTGIRGTGQLVLIKTTPGNAGGVAELVDHLDRPEIVGTVAGDDTILVVVDAEGHRKKIEDVFLALI